MSPLPTVRIEHESGGRVQPGLRSSLAGALVMTVLVAGAGAWSAVAHHASRPTYTYGALPSWLPTAATPTNRVLDASVSHPQLAIEGDVVHVALGAGVSVTVTMSGPQTPPFVAPPPPYTTATITIGVRRATGAFELCARDFALIDGNGTVFRPATFLDGRRQVRVSSDGATAVRLREFMAIGSGSIRWAPAGHPMVTWEFTVEND